MAAVVYLADRRGGRIAKALTVSGHHVYSAYSPDLAVCLCVQHYVEIAVLQQDLFVETAAGSIAQSIKGVRPTMRVILVTEAEIVGKSLPTGVDAVVRQGDVPTLLRMVHEEDKRRRISRPNSCSLRAQ